MTMPSAGILAAFCAHHAAFASTSASSTTSVKTPRCSSVEAAHGVAGEEEPAGQHRSEPVEEQVERAERRAEEARGRHADLGVAGDDRDVGHERELEAAAERVARAPRPR